MTRATYHERPAHVISRARLDAVEKRRLPLLKTHDEGGDEPPRPPWQWVGFGTVAIFVVWTPVVWFAEVVAARVMAAPELARERAVILSVALGIGALAGGFVVGRWGTRGVGVREAALAGVVAATVATVLSWTTLGLSIGSLVTVVIAAPAAALGGRFGVGRRARGP